MAAERFLDTNVLFYLLDAMIVAAAKLANRRLLLSEDMHHGARLDGVEVRNPFR